jgi:hypothetical protein
MELFACLNFCILTLIKPVAEAEDKQDCQFPDDALMVPFSWVLLWNPVDTWEREHI